MSGTQAILNDVQLFFTGAVDAGVALPLQPVLNFFLREIVRDGDFEGNHDAQIGVGSDPVLADVFRCIASDFAAAAATVEFGGPCEQQFDVIIQFSHRADRRARCAHRVCLVDGDGRWYSLNTVNTRLVHAIKELTCIR